MAWRRASIGDKPARRFSSVNATGAVAQSDPWISKKENYREVVQYVNDGKLVPLESVRLTENSGFWDAVEAGREAREIGLAETRTSASATSPLTGFDGCAESSLTVMKWNEVVADDSK